MANLTSDWDPLEIGSGWSYQSVYQNSTISSLGQGIGRKACGGILRTGANVNVAACDSGSPREGAAGG